MNTVNLLKKLSLVTAGSVLICLGMNQSANAFVLFDRTPNTNGFFDFHFTTDQESFTQDLHTIVNEGIVGVPEEGVAFNASDSSTWSDALVFRNGNNAQGNNTSYLHFYSDPNIPSGLTSYPLPDGAVFETPSELYGQLDLITYIVPDNTHRYYIQEVVPEPSSVMGIIGLVAIGAISTLKRQYKTTKST